MTTSSDTYLIGVGGEDITPPVGIYLAGFAARTEPSTAVYHPLKANAIAIDDGNEPLIIASAEILGFYEHTEEVRSRISALTGVVPANIVLSGSHTHCGPCIREMDRHRHGDLDEDYIERLLDSVTRCAKTAWETRSPARLRFGNGHCDIAVSRRKSDGKGGVEWKPGPGAPHDHEVPVLAVESPEGELRSVIFSYACHPTSRSGTLIGGDYVCYAYDHVEAMHPGVTAFFLQGCAGDQKTRPVDPAEDRFIQRNIQEIRDIGVLLGESVVRVLASGGLEQVTGPVSVRQDVIGLDTEPIDMDLVRAGLKADQGYIQAWARHLLDSVENNAPVVTNIPFEIQTVRFGNALALVTLAGEMTVEHGLRLKRELGSRVDNVMVLAYTNDIVGYVPVRRQIPEGGYEVWASQQYWKRTGPYVAETEDRIHAAVRRSLGIS
ncbi:MAG: neutral/alkaline non-lysosomal ceramidase N-terminal domain-containing protein [Gemmatimonadota bacterium]|nr:neutral/alkaline non-lysosomal ceramidase N-terminal domain-containing protein [Gemmatimonadota bacterium]